MNATGYASRADILALAAEFSTAVTEDGGLMLLGPTQVQVRIDGYDVARSDGWPLTMSDARELVRVVGEAWTVTLHTPGHGVCVLGTHTDRAEADRQSVAAAVFGRVVVAEALQDHVDERMYHCSADTGRCLYSWTFAAKSPSAAESRFRVEHWIPEDIEIRVKESLRSA